MKVIKSNTYNIINSEPFDITFPLEFELFIGNTLLAEYRVSEDGTVDYGFNPNTTEKILTSTTRPLTLNDIYFLISSRVVPDNTPLTPIELERFEMEEYNPYQLFKKTHGILLGDNYWFRFSGEEYNYKKVMKDFSGYHERYSGKYIEKQRKLYEENFVKQQAEIQNVNVNKILKQHDIDFDMLTQIKQGSTFAPDEFIKQYSGESTSSVPKPEIIKEADKSNEEELVSSAGVEMMSDDDISKMFASISLEAEKQEEQPTISDDKMSDDMIAALFSQAGGETKQEEEKPAANEKMSDDAIAALFSQVGGEAKQEEEKPAANEKMSDDAIAALFSQVGGEAKQEEEKPAANEKMSDDAIAALFSQAGGEAKQEEEKPAANEKMSDDAIAALFAQANGG